MAAAGMHNLLMLSPPGSDGPKDIPRTSSRDPAGFLRRRLGRVSLVWSFTFAESIQSAVCPTSYSKETHKSASVLTFKA
ncbi:MAG: hypothetical protein AAF802_18570 [Planctomycetota bacterium]